MNKNKLLLTIAGGTAASLAVGCLVQKGQFQPAVSDTTSVTETANLADATIAQMTAQIVATRAPSISIRELPKEWTKSLDREFRLLAAQEAQGTISKDGGARLRLLDTWRERLVAPRTADDILFQLKRDRMLEQFSKTFEDYAQFKTGANRQRTAPV